MSTNSKSLASFQDAFPEDHKAPSSISENHVSEPQLRFFLPVLQIFLVVVALNFQSLRANGDTILGVSLDGWAVPPECILFCMTIVMLAIQQFGWEVELLEVEDEVGVDEKADR